MNLKEAKFWADNGMFVSVAAKVECGTTTIAAASSKEVVDWLIAEVERLKTEKDKLATELKLNRMCPHCQKPVYAVRAAEAVRG